MSLKPIGTYHLAKLCHVSPMTIGRWIKDGKLPAFKTAGGQSRIWTKDAVALLRRLDIPFPPELEAAGQLRILVVDDEASVRGVLLRYLKGFFPEAELLEAADGFQAGKLVAGNLPGIVILDLNLPGVDGFEVLRSIKSDPRLKEIKVLAITGYHVAEWKQRALDAGADAFLPKPVEGEALERCLHRMAGKQKGAVL